MYWICLCFRLCPIGILPNYEATLEKIWKTVETVWNETSSSEVARAFVLAYRVMEVIIAENGNNSFLAHGTPHTGTLLRLPQKKACPLRGMLF
jgi:hypothetical protein